MNPNEKKKDPSPRSNLGDTQEEILSETLSLVIAHWEELVSIIQDSKSPQQKAELYLGLYTTLIKRLIENFVVKADWPRVIEHLNQYFSRELKFER